LLGQWRATGGQRLPEYAALAGAVRGLLRDARLSLGVRLPAERELADALAISRTTVTAAYRELRESGHLTSRRGAGSWTALPGGQRLVGAGLWTSDRETDALDLSCAVLPAPTSLGEAAAEAMADLPRYTTGSGYHPTGIPELREAVANTYARRGLPTRPDQIMITNGAQHALDLVLRLLLAPGQPVLAETPTYANALAALRAHRGRLTGHAIDPEHGWDGDLLLDSLRVGRPKLAYVIPEFHNPTGHLMRERLVAAAHSAGTDLVVDESFVELSLDGAVEPPVATFDRHARVLSVGSMSKPYWGGLRIGWIRAAAPLVQRLSAARVAVDMSGPLLDQVVAVRLLERHDEVVGERRALLRQRRAVFADALRERLPEWRFRVPDGGLSFWVELDAPISTALAHAAATRSVRLAPGPRFGLEGTLERYLRLPFTLPEEELVETADRLARARADLDRSAPLDWTAPALVA
jgi:DNA-binding transcriptional MocR family regulator